MTLPISEKMSTRKSALKATRTALSPKKSRSISESDLDKEASSSIVERKNSVFNRRRTRPRIDGREPTSASADKFEREWGISLEKEDALLTEFRKAIEEKRGPLRAFFDKYYLRRFLRARQHDIPRALAMFLNHLDWREENNMDTILEDFHFHERDAFLTLYPQGYHMTDKTGRPIYIQHLGQINVKALQAITTVERMVRYHVQEYERALKYIFPSCSKVAGRHIDQTLTILDVQGVGLRHLTGDVKRIMSLITRVDQDNYPETLGKTVIINAPGVFKMIWAIVKPMLDVRTQSKIEVAPTNYMPVILKYADEECIPEYLGGKSKASLLDDVGPWNDVRIVSEIDTDIAQRDGLPAPVKVHLHLEGGSPSGLHSPASPCSEEIRHGSDFDEEFFDTLSRRHSMSSIASSTFASAEEDVGTSQLQSPLLVSPSAVDSDFHPIDTPLEKEKESISMQIPILARVRALEEKIPDVERPVRRYLPPSQAHPSRDIGQGTLASRVTALEKAMEALLRAQEVALERSEQESSRCCACCSIM